jgi:hypothetical protein
MEPSRQSPALKTFAARFERGPRDGSVANVAGLESGHPPDFLLHAGHSDGVYALAGGPRSDGSLPYWWMPRRRSAVVRALGDKRPVD